MAEYLSKCPHCEANLQLNDEWVGIQVQCPICSKYFIATKANPTPPLPKAVKNKETNEDDENMKTVQGCLSLLIIIILLLSALGTLIGMLKL